MINTRAFASLLLTGLLAVGCAPKAQTTLNPPPPEPNPEPQLASDARERIKELVGRVEEYAGGAGKLPGRNEADDRAQVTQQFTLLAQILPILSGPDMTGDFRQQLRIVDSTRAQLTSGSADLSIEPTVDTGLRAAQQALVVLAQRSFSELPDVAKSLDTMRAKNEELDGVTGALHRLVASQSFQASAEAITQMSAALDQRLNDPKGAAPAKPVAENKPAEAKPAEAKPAEPAPAQPKPAEAKPAEPAPAEAKPAEPKPAEPKPAEPKPELNK
jgi:hypothetical protein